MKCPQRANKNRAASAANGRKARRASPWGRRPHVNHERNHQRLREWQEEQ